MPNPESLATFTPFHREAGPVVTAQKVTLKTNLSGDPIRFSINESLDSIVPTATLTILNAEITELGHTEIGVIGGEYTPEDESPWGKEVPKANVEPNEFIYVVEILGDYIETDDGNGNLTYTATGTGEVCTTHWRVVSVSMSTNEANIPVCDVQLEGTSKIAQEAKIDAPLMSTNWSADHMATPMTFSDNSIVIIEKNYLDSVYYYGEKYRTDDNYGEARTLEEFIHNLQYGTDITTKTTVTTGGAVEPYPNKISLTYPPSNSSYAYNGYYQDGHHGITGILRIQKALNALGYKGANNASLTQDGIYGSNTKHAVADFQKYKYDHGAKDLTPSAFGTFGPKTWKYLITGSTTTTTTSTVHINPPILLVVVEDYDTYLDIFFDRIKDLGYTFTFKYNGTTYNTYSEMADAHPWMSLKYIPLYTVYETSDTVWEKMNNIFAFNGLNARFRRDNSLLVWPSDSMQVIDPTYEKINIVKYGTGLSYSYTKEGVINKANVKGWLGKKEGEYAQIVDYKPSLVPSKPYPNSVVLQYPPLPGYGTYMDDTDSGIDGVHDAQYKLGVGLGYKGADGHVLGHDGYFGPNTKYAVKTFQAKKNIKATPDGKLDSTTWDILFGQNMSSGMTRAQVYHEITNHLTFTDGAATPTVYLDPLTISSSYETDTLAATYDWLKSVLPELYPAGIKYTITDGTKQITWAEFSKWINAFIDTIKVDYYENFWIPDSKEQHSVIAYSGVADGILNIRGDDTAAVAQDFDVSADYLLSSERELENWGRKEIFKTVMMARTGSYNSGGLPLYSEVGMQIEGYSELTGKTIMLITSISRTTDAQQQTIETSISGNVMRAGKQEYDTKGKTVDLDGIVWAPEKYLDLDGIISLT